MYSLLEVVHWIATYNGDGKLRSRLGPNVLDRGRRLVQGTNNIVYATMGSSTSSNTPKIAAAPIMPGQFPVQSAWTTGLGWQSLLHWLSLSRQSTSRLERDSLAVASRGHEEDEVRSRAII